MTWGVWLGIWAASIAFTAVVVVLILLLGFWAYAIVFPVLIVGLGWVVVESGAIR